MTYLIIDTIIIITSIFNIIPIYNVSIKRKKKKNTIYLTPPRCTNSLYTLIYVREISGCSNDFLITVSFLSILNTSILFFRFAIRVKYEKEIHFITRQIVIFNP